MKITIEPEPKNKDDAELFKRMGVERIVYTRVTQFVLGGTQLANGLYMQPFRRCVIGDANMLLGTIAALAADIENRKAAPLAKAVERIHARMMKVTNDKNANA